VSAIMILIDSAYILRLKKVSFVDRFLKLRGMFTKRQLIVFCISIIYVLVYFAPRNIGLADIENPDIRVSFYDYTIYKDEDVPIIYDSEKTELIISELGRYKAIRNPIGNLINRRYLIEGDIYDISIVGSNGKAFEVYYYQLYKNEFRSNRLSDEYEAYFLIGEGDGFAKFSKLVCGLIGN